MEVTLKKVLIFIVLCLFFYTPALFAGEADVIHVEVKKESHQTFFFSVTIQHKDTGWKHYANRWDIIGQNGVVFGTRVLYHPHVNEQPFTRSLSGVKIPDTVNSVLVRGHDSVHQYGGKVLSVELP